MGAGRVGSAAGSDGLGRTTTLDRFRAALPGIGLGTHGLSIARRRRPRPEDRGDALQAGNRSAQRPSTIGIASRPPSTTGRPVSGTGQPISGTGTNPRPGLETLSRSRAATARILSRAPV
jgi:hypothetical protein